VDFSASPYDLVRRGRLYLHDYHYPLVLERLRQEFGKDRVLVKKYETLRSNPRSFAEDICGFLHVPTPDGVDFATVNRYDASIPVDPNTVEKIRQFFAAHFDYASIAEGSTSGIPTSKG